MQADTVPGREFSCACSDRVLASLLKPNLTDAGGIPLEQLRHRMATVDELPRRRHA
jgi:hypothetical protein